MVSPVGGAASKLTKLHKLFSISFLTVVLVVILSHAIIISIQQKSAEPGLRDVGKRFAGVTQDIDEEAKGIIALKGVYDGSRGALRGSWNAFLVFAILLSSLGVFWLWIRILAWAIEHTVSDSTAQFRNYFMAVFVFFVVQIIYLLVTSDEPNKFALITKPFFAFWHLWQAIPYLIAPVDTAINTVDASPALNNTIGKILWIS